MASSDAILSQEMATRHKKSLGVVLTNFPKINALLNVAINKGKVKYGSFGTNFEWYINKYDVSTEATWTSGQLGTRTFEEIDPVNKAYLPICLMESTYGVSEKSLKSNRAGGDNKIFDIQKKNAEAAQVKLYRSGAVACYYGGTNTQVPVGLVGVCGKPYTTSNTAHTPASQSYANIALTTGAISAWAANKGSYTNAYWAPEVADVQELPSVETSKTWANSCVYALAGMENLMTRKADMSGTGKDIKPDMAFMNRTRFQQLRNMLIKSQLTYNIPVGSQDLELNGFANIRVGGLTVVLDDNVPDDNDYNASGSGNDMIFVVDSSAFWVETWNTKAEGLFEAQWKQDDPQIVGGVGVYKSNLGFGWESPTAVGCITISA